MSTKKSQFANEPTSNQVGTVERQLQWYLFSLRIYLATKRQYERKYHQIAISSVNRDNETQLQTINTSYKFPELPGPYKVYNIVTNTVLAWVLLKYLFPVPFNGFHKLLYELTLASWWPAGVEDLSGGLDCFSFGRIMVHYDVSDEAMGCIIASWHICWRLAQATLGRPFSLDVVLFLLQPREDIEQFICKLELSNESIERARRRQKRLSLPYRSDTTTTCLGLNYSNLNQKERLLCDIMCFKVIILEDSNKQNKPDHQDDQAEAIFETPPRFVYKLRPNRTLEAHQRLVRLLADTTTKGLRIFLTLGVCFGLYLVPTILFNQRRYVKSFGACKISPRASQLEVWSNPQLSGHRFASLLADLLENYFVWTESGLVLVFALMFASFLNKDLLNYWSHLEARIETLSIDSRNVHHLFLMTTTTANNNNNKNRHLDLTDRILRTFREEIYEFQAELGDFYRQIQRVDLLVSDIITHALLIWLTAFGYLSYKSAELWSSTRNGEFALICIFISAFVFLGYSIVSVSLLSLQRRCHLAFTNLCSLMAHDQSRYKAHFCQLIRYYTDKNRTCYTWFQQVPFSSANFLSVIGWSFSGFLVLDNVYNRH